MNPDVYDTLRVAAEVTARLRENDAMIEVAARALYERDEASNRDSADAALPWVDTLPEVRENYRKDLTPVVRDLLHYLTDIPKETPA